MSVALEAHGLHKRFGGIAAADGAHLRIEAGKLHALIGPNGAGKSTLIGLLSGALRPDAGTITLHGHDITTRSVHERVKLGLARSYQITSVFGALTPLENVALALQARRGGDLNLWQPRARDASLRDDAAVLLERVALDASTTRPAQQLAHGEQRKLELALSLASGARVLLLDEPLAGMGEQEAHSMIELISRLKGSLGVLLIEHDMDAVFRLADRISVLVAGKVIASGTAEEIRADTQVRAAYLGDEA